RRLSSPPEPRSIRCASRCPASPATPTGNNLPTGRGAPRRARSAAAYTVGPAQAGSHSSPRLPRTLRFPSGWRNDRLAPQARKLGQWLLLRAKGSNLPADEAPFRRNCVVAELLAMTDGVTGHEARDTGSDLEFVFPGAGGRRTRLLRARGARCHGRADLSGRSRL